MAEKFDGITPPDNVSKGKVNLSPKAEKHVADFSKDYNLSENQAIVGAVDYYQTRCKQLEKWGNDIKEQAEKEISELKVMVEKLIVENKQLKVEIERLERDGE